MDENIRQPGVELPYGRADSTQDATTAKMEKHAESLLGFLDKLQGNVLGALSENSLGPEGFIENFQAFRAAIDWGERWIQGVLAFHTFLLLLFILTRKHFASQVGLFAVIIIGVRSSEYINTFLRHHWRDFSRQNYFDEHGVFMGVMWAGPLLLVGFAILINLLCEAASLLVKVKTEQFKREIAARRAANRGGEGKDKQQQSMRQKDGPKVD